VKYEISAASQYLLQLPPYPPIVKGWNRLEGRPRTLDYERALRAEARDALWFLCRQWQFGELQGEDTGSPVDARVVVRSTPLVHFAAAGQPAVAHDARTPLEARAECERMPRDLNMHVDTSRTFFRSVASRLPGKLIQARAEYQAHYPLNEASLSGWLDADTKSMLPLAAAAAVDAGKLLDEIASGAHDAFLAALPGAFSAGDQSTLRDVAEELARQFGALYTESAGPDAVAWNGRFLEYQFSCAAESTDRPQIALTAEGYASGHLDWYSFDIDARPESRLTRDGAEISAVEETALSFLPAPVSFGGMPNPRYWEMENSKTEFADIDANTTDIARLLLTEFALVYGNDWCVIPYEVDIGAVHEVVGLLMTDDFGEQILVPAAGQGIDDVWQRWSMFTLSTNAASGAADTLLFMPPALTKSLDAEPIEKVHFLRDEMANMAWAIERVIPAASGAGTNGYDATRPATVSTPPSTAGKAPAKYTLGTEVPNNWHPFVPVHVPDGNRKVQLQRSRMPGPDREIYGKVLAKPSPYYVNEEEVPRAGKIVTRRIRRARWLDGSTFVWVGRRATTGKGEGSSGLAFDKVIESKKRE
jgi:hypothetical protein